MSQVPALMQKKSDQQAGRNDKPHTNKKPHSGKPQQGNKTANGRPSLGDQLRKQYRQRNTEVVIPSPMSLKGDGEDHINVSEFGKTELGRLLFTRNEDIPLKHDIFGHFATIYGYWAYLKSGMACDQVRTLTGRRLEARIKKLPKANAVNFRAMLADGIYQRIMGSPKLIELVKANKLPYELYSENQESGLRQRPPFYSWFIAALNEVCAAVVANRTPNLKFLRDDRCKPEGSDIYHNFLPEHMRERRRQNAEIAEIRELSKKEMEATEAAKLGSREAEEDAAWANHVRSGQDLEAEATPELEEFRENVFTELDKQGSSKIIDTEISEPFNTAIKDALCAASAAAAEQPEVSRCSALNLQCQEPADTDTTVTSTTMATNINMCRHLSGQLLTITEPDETIKKLPETCPVVCESTDEQSDKTTDDHYG